MMKTVTFGEVMMRLTPKDNRLLGQADSFDVHFGGSEYNVAAGLRSLGKRAMCITRLPENPLGWHALSAMRANEVEVPGNIMSPLGRMGIYFLEPGSSPRPNRVVYDRAESAFAMSGAAAEFDWVGDFEDACWFHVSGITPALSSALLTATEEAIDKAREKGVLVSMDINFRARLWSAEDAREALEPLLKKACLIETTEEDLERVFDIAGATTKELAERARDHFETETLAITLRDMVSVKRNVWGGCAVGPDGYVESRRYDVEVVDRVGAGDAFTAGLISGMIDGMELEYSVNLAAAFSALKQTIPGDICTATSAQCEELMEKGAPGRIQR